MIFLSALKLSQRLMLSMAVMVVAMAVIVITGYQLSEQAVFRLNGVYDQANVKTIAGVRLGKAYSQDLVSLVHKLALGSYPWEAGLGRLDEIDKNIECNLAILRKPPLDRDETRLLQDIEAKDAVVNDFIYKLRPVLLKKDGRALRSLNRRLYPAVDPMGFRIQLFLDYELGRSKVLVEDNRNNFRQSYGWMAAIVLATVFAIFGIVFNHLERTVCAPLGILADRMKVIAGGEGDLTKRLEVTGKDEIGEVAEAFNTFVEKLQGVEDMKLDLISVVSHQLKTPVAEINGFIENMLQGLTGEINPKQKRYLDEMRLVGQGNYRLINDLLNTSKIDRGIIRVDLKPVAAREVVAMAIRDYEVLLQRKGLELRLEGLEEGVMLFADRDKTVEALRNLLDNAIKCTDKGSVILRVGSEGDEGVIEVEDTGIGMDEETLGRLFTKSRVLGKEAHRSGAGLGLYISKNFMKLQNGGITVASEAGKGSRFKLVIPKAAVGATA